jgi:hypothetical protein
LATGEGDGEGDNGQSMMLSGAVEDVIDLETGFTVHK